MGRLLALPVNIRVWGKWLAVTTTLSYKQYSINYECKNVYGDDPNVITAEQLNLNGYISKLEGFSPPLISALVSHFELVKPTQRHRTMGWLW